MRFFRIVGTACLAALLAVSAAAAQEARQEEGTEEAKAPARLSTMDTVVVTATKTEHALGDVPANVSVLTREEIEQAPGTTVLDAMKQMPGVTVDMARGPYGTSTNNTVTIRGMGGDDPGRVLVMIDGMPVNAPGSAIFEWTSINKDSVERIEVVRGPASALYGSSAMGGAINIITRKPVKDGFSTTLDSKYGTYETSQTSLYHSGRVGRFGYWATGEYLRSDGFNAVSDASRRQRASGPERVESENAALNMTWSPDETADFTLMGEYDDYERPGRYLYDRNYKLYTYTRKSLSAKLRKDFGPVESSLSLRGDYLNSDYDTAASNSRQLANTSPALQRFYSGDLQNGFALGEHNFITAGVSGYYGSQDRDMIYYNTSRTRERGGQQNNYAAYLQDEISLLDGDLAIVPGLRYDYWRTEGYDRDTNLSNPARKDYEADIHNNLSKKLGLRYTLPTKIMTWRANYGEAYRIGSLDDYYGEFKGTTALIYRGNPNLKPEESQTLDIGFELSPVQSFSFGLTGYKTWARNYISYVDKPAEGGNAVKQYDNIGKVSIVGFEAFAKWQADERWHLFADYTGLDPSISAGPNDGKQVTGVPLSKGTMGFVYDNPAWFTLRVAGNWLGTVWYDDANTVDEGQYLTWDVRLSRRFAIDESTWIEPYLEAQNLTGEKEVRTIPSSRVATNLFYGGVRVGF